MNPVICFIKHIPQHSVIITTIALGFPWIGFSEIAWADPVTFPVTGALSSTASLHIPFNPPQGGAPTQTRGGASRSGDACLESATPSTPSLTSLTPPSNYGLTTAGHPTFFAYIPPSAAAEAFFSLSGADGTVLYQDRVSIPSQGGIIPIQIPQTVSPLEFETFYQWGVAILCSGQLEPDSPFVSSWVKRVKPDSTWDDQMNATASVEQAILYGEQGIWYDTLDTLFQLSQQSPDSSTITDAWATLLNTAGLEEIAAEPIVF